MSQESIDNTDVAHLTDDLDERFRCLVQFAILAPSGHNTQPWLFRRRNDFLELLADRTRGLPVADPHDRELTISCGAALDHLCVAARHYGWELDCHVRPGAWDSDVLARVYIRQTRPPDPHETRLVEAIGKRHTNRAAYESLTLPEDLVEQCRHEAAKHSVELSIITDVERRLALGELVAEAERQQFDDVRFRRELASWVHSRRRASRDGMSGSGFGMPDVLSPLGALVIRSFDIGDGIAASDKEKIAGGSPTLAVFSSVDDSVGSWLSTGQAHSRILLTLTAAGVSASYLNAPVELEHLRPTVATVSGCGGKPQLIMRFGYGPAVEATVRREVYDVYLT